MGCLALHGRDAGYRVEELAVRLGVSTRALRRWFKDDCGLGLKDWLVAVRSIEVRSRLRGKENIQEIALSVGFSHAKELSREFNRVHGVTPSEYRRRERGRTTPEDPS